ncbi:MAG: sugar epimerase [Parcubacteria group bacterium RIFCSPLOWO2_01_FULL_40_65]|nr:MAG: sugar epimerase [Parcubacteria group bacterium RIFCSPHIGHO2_01_FULL_40_30]OHB19341.1 MAG: sugar epimerase [Parcubacteria group bacterium RIFCSPHIGHO2_02_FULL_40_12]OHB21228.1 MAG: sugar epimerase [Parcubacteria group bacterium RIFCSPLOWO2_01_FULL_40_65]OHB22957.1 MAG: sugar epimerase [Parcubacteria group bacterium RIFCSPLOWO2_02_FULL_40_12]OHB23855.1 MAG: sugar epimerase [Parcubacteria group bacterium RIFCSPLOWO2_12_FULL_40_10]
MNSKNNIKLIDGGLAVDDRGTVRFVNDFDFNGVKRFYQVENHQKGFIRAWHGHKKESKYVYVSSGTALVGVVDLKTQKIRKFILSDKKPQVLWIPPNHANGFMNLEDNTDVLFFSTSTLKESAGDDIRFPYNQWDIWEIERR